MRDSCPRSKGREFQVRSVLGKKGQPRELHGVASYHHLGTAQRTMDLQTRPALARTGPVRGADSGPEDTFGKTQFEKEQVPPVYSFPVKVAEPWIKAAASTGSVRSADSSQIGEGLAMMSQKDKREVGEVLL